MLSLLPDILFYIFSSLAVAGGLFVLVRRSPMTCAVSLVVSVLSVAILYFLLSAHFIAVAQMIVYAGAIVVLFIFVILLLNLSDEEIGKFRFSLFKLVGVFVALAILLAAAPAIRSAVPAPEAGRPAYSAGEYGTTKAVARLLLGEYALAFELTGVLILAAMVAGVVLAKKEMTPRRVFSPIDWLLEFFKS